MMFIAENEFGCKNNNQHYEDDGQICNHQKIYFCYCNALCRARSGSNSSQTERLHQVMTDVEQNIAQWPIFLNRAAALSYSRFVDKNCTILKAYVPERCIEGCAGNLFLKPATLSQQNIYSLCMPVSSQSEEWLNPSFNEKYLVCED